MSQFHFRLRSLETLRRQTRERCQLELAGAVSDRQRLVEERDAIDRKLDRLQSGLRAGVAPGRINLAQLAAAGDFERCLQAEHERLCQVAIALEAEVARRRADLIDADREVKALEKLCQLRHEQYLAGERRSAGKALDDAAVRQLRREPLA